MLTQEDGTEPKMAKRNRVIAARMKNPQIYDAIDAFKAKTGISDSELVRYALENLLFERGKGPLVPESLKNWARKFVLEEDGKRV